MIFNEAGKRAVVSTAGTLLVDTVNMLQAAGDEGRGFIDGSWGDSTYRLAGLLHMYAGICLVPELFNVWRPSLADAANNPDVPYMNNDYSEPWLTGLWPSAGPADTAAWGPDRSRYPAPSDPRICDWDQNPASFVVQLRTVHDNLRDYLLSHSGLRASVPTMSATNNPQTWTPQAVSADLQSGLDTINEIVSSEVVTDLLGTIGLSSSSYGIPIFGWALAVVDAIIQIAYAIFGTASGVQTITATPLVDGERNMFEHNMAGVIFVLRRMLDECRALSVVRRLPAGRVRVSKATMNRKTAMQISAIRAAAQPLGHPPLMHDRRPRWVAPVAAGGAAAVAVALAVLLL
jgi:hypothetical protein